MEGKDDDDCSSSSAVSASVITARNISRQDAQHANLIGRNNQAADHDRSTHSFAVTEESISGKPYPIPPNVVQFVQMPKTHLNHTYRDFTNIPPDTSYDFPASIECMTFHERLYHLLSFTNVSCRQYISWCCRGRAFEVLDADGLESLGVLRCYFGYNCIQRFRKQLNTFGYKRLVREASLERYYSEFLLQDLPHLLQYSPPSKNRRRLLPDPHNEPNFGLISHLFPLPSDRRDLVTEARIRLEARGCYISDTVYEMVASRPSSTAATGSSSLHWAAAAAATTTGAPPLLLPRHPDR